MTAPRRRWFRFSLLTLFVVVTVVAIPLGWLGWRMAVERERATLLKMLDGRGRAFESVSRAHLGMVIDSQLTMELNQSAFSSSEIARYRHAFPEYEIILVDKDSPGRTQIQ